MTETPDHVYVLGYTYTCHTVIHTTLCVSVIFCTVYKSV